MQSNTSAGGAAPSKTCASCGRRIEWRKKWARDWEQVRYCSAACRRRGVTSIDRELEEVILRLLRARGHGATICPSDAARAVAAGQGVERQGVEGQGVEGVEGGSQAWRELMEPARRAARRLVAEGSVQVTQRGQVVDPSTARGAIRIRLRR